MAGSGSLGMTPTAQVLVDPSTDEHTNPPHSLRIVVPFIPPSSNKIYVTDWRRKRRFKGKEAVAFEQQFKSTVVPEYLPWISRMTGPEQDPSVIYAVAIDFYFPRDQVMNKTWGDGTKNAAKTRYKKMDTGNRLKLIYDCLSDALQIDDSHFFQVGGRKLVAESFSMEPQVHIFLNLQTPSLLGA